MGATGPIGLVQNNIVRQPKHLRRQASHALQGVNLWESALRSSTQPFLGLRSGITLFIVLAELGHLAWELTHGGVLTHHILQRADMPGISNWWGLLVLPALAWFLGGRIERRRAADLGSGFNRSVVVGAIGGLVFGVLLSTTFVLRQEDLSFYVLLSLLFLALVLPIYRAECVLGFVLGMVFTFGALISTAMASTLALISAAIHLLLYPSLGRVWRAVTKSGAR